MREVLSGACVLLALLCGVVGLARAQGAGAEGDEVAVRQAGRVRAPELAGGRGWLNTDGPLSLAALRGKVVLLDFWTYGCINCIHIIPDLKKLEAKYPNSLVVVGVHSAKFENEKETENIRRVVLRYGVEHPVVNDADFKIWEAYAVNAWPTQVLIDPAGYVYGRVAGEGHYAELDEAIGKLVAEFRGRGQLDERPLNLALERAKVGDLPLAFPGKVLADERGGRLFVSDSNHNRVVVAKLDGTLLYTVGSGEAGLKDGASDAAQFRQPQGLALDGETLYVADTGNHSIRRVDLKTRAVETIAGTGAQSRDYRTQSGPARSTALSSPWDLLLKGETLYVAMAGPHQLWKLDLKRGEVSVFAGSGVEARLDGTRAEAGFAQPSGLATDGETLFVADSESNIIRAVSLAEGVGPKAEVREAAAAPTAPKPEEVRTLAGGDLFVFGDRDGRGDEVRLQHPLGLFFHDGRLYVADTYNHKIKTLDPDTRAAKTFAGTGKAGQADGARPSFYEPGGLSAAGGKLYVADTNNHAVRVVDLRTKETSTLALRGLQPPPAATERTEEEATRDSAGPNAEEVKVETQRLAAGDASLVVDVSLPAGYHLNPSAPHRYAVSVEDGRGAVALAASSPAGGATMTKGGGKDFRLPLRLPLKAATAGASAVRVSLTIYYCREDNTGVCRVKTLLWRAPVEVANDPASPREVKLQGKVE
jgi:sugar lactone lactonase YvrE